MTGANAASQAANRPIRKFNPGTHQSDEEVIEQFVVRKRELDTVLEVLRGNVDSASCQHVMVVGPRGRGKTMLLVRTAAELRTDQQLAKCLFPVRFMEESQEIFNVADFWLETLFHLARETAEQDRGLSQDLRETYGDLSSRWREQSHEALARAAVLEAADRLDRKLVLMVENLQSLCENVDEDFGWKLRGALQSEPQVTLLASSTSRFEGLDDAEQPFFELFRTINMQPLDTDACRLLWQVVSGDTVSSREIRPLQILTGGNPRLLVIVAEFARHRSLRRLMEELVTLIDEHTEYFRGHLEVLAKTERRVYVSVMDLWQPSSAGEIATRARMGVRTVSTMLGRLVERGAVIVEGRGRRRLYAPAEPLYSIYYKLRRERDEAAIVENLVKFMVVFYSGSELVDMSDGLVMEAAESTVIRTGIFRALADRLRFENPTPPAKWRIMQQVSERAIEKAQSTVEKELLEEINASRQARAFENVIETVERIIVSRSTDRTQLSELFIARILHCKADAQERLGHFRAVAATCEEVVVRFGDSVVPGLQWRVAEALIDMGRVRKEMGDLDAATAACEEVVERFGDSEESDVQWWVAAALVDNGRSKKELGDLEGAIATWDEVAERYGDTDVSELEWWVALALIDKGRAKKEQGDPVGAIDTWEEVVHRYGETDVSDVQWWVALALIDKGRVKKEQGDLEAATAAFEEVMERFGDSDVSDLQQRVALALIEKGRAKKEQGDLEGAVAMWQEVVERYGDSDVSDLQQWVAVALVNEGMRQAEMGRAVEALHVCEELERRIGALPETGDGRLRWQVLCVRALAQMVLKKKGAAMEAFHSAYAAFTHDNEISIREMLQIVPNLVAAGASEHELVDILSGDPAKSAALTPLIVALRERQGEKVRAPSEVREVAADVREHIEERVKCWEETTADSAAVG